MASSVPGSRKSGFWLAFKVVELRLRFVVVLAATGLAFAYSDSIRARYDKWRRPAAVAEVARPGLEFFCPMHPQVIGEEPASCPICGMPLSKRRRGEAASFPEGTLARVTLAPGRIGQAGVRTVEVGYSAMSETLTTVGTVEYDERRVRRISSKVRGMARVEKLHVDFLGADVRAGQPMAELYGPELYQAVRELILARKRSGNPAGDSSPDMVGLSTDKLRLMGVTQEQVDAILRSGKAEFSLPILAPIGGHVVRKDVVEGQYVSEGQTLFEVADLDVVWIKARDFEGQLPLVRLGQGVEAVVGSAPGERFAGKVAYIPPHVDPNTRAVEVRFEVDNPGHRLRPGSFATVTLTTPIAETPLFRGRIASAHAEHDAPTVANQKTCPVTGGPLGSMGEPVATEAGGRMIWTCCAACPPKIHASPAKYLARLARPPVDGVLAVPESAVIDTGSLTMVYVEVEPGVFEGRKVTLGPRSGDRFPVLEGLAPGENVVAQGAFLVDAESRLDPSTRPEPPAPPPAKSDGRSASAETPIRRR